MSDLGIQPVKPMDVTDIDAIMRDSISGHGKRPFKYTDEYAAFALEASAQHMDLARAYKIGIDALEQLGDHGEARAQREWGVVEREVAAARYWNHYAVFIRRKLRATQQAPKQATLL